MTAPTLGPVSAAKLSAIVQMVTKAEISHATGRQVLDVLMVQPELDPREIVEERGLWLMNTAKDAEAISKIVDDLIRANPDKAEQAKAKPKAVGWFVGQVMKLTNGRADPRAVEDCVKRKIET